LEAKQMKGLMHGHGSGRAGALQVLASGALAMGKSAREALC
jgi:hypothetical protein